MTRTSAGAIRFMVRNRVWQGGGSSDRTRTGDARYYVDGYLAAVQFPDGRIEIFITGHAGSDDNPKDLSYVYWNGALFGPE